MGTGSDLRADVLGGFLGELSLFQLALLTLRLALFVVVRAPKQPRLTVRQRHFCAFYRISLIAVAPLADSRSRLLETSVHRLYDRSNATRIALSFEKRIHVYAGFGMIDFGHLITM